MIGPGVTVPDGVSLPPGAVVPPGYEWPVVWTLRELFEWGILEPPQLPPGYIPGGPAAPYGGEPWAPGPVQQPGRSPTYEKAAVITAGSNDGQVRNSGTNWAAVISDDVGTLAKNDQEESSYGAAYIAEFGGTYYLSRGFFEFDLSGVSGTIVSATIRFYHESEYDCVIRLYEGLQGNPLSVNDLRSYKTTYFAEADPWPADYKTMTLNAAGLNYVESVFGSTARFCTREHYYDVGGNLPTGVILTAGCYYSEATEPLYRPRLSIVYK